MNVQVLINKWSCAKELYKIVIKRWRIAPVFQVNLTLEVYGYPR